MQIIVKNPAAMQRFGAALATLCQPGCIIYLEGELGAGKTTLVRGFLHKLGWHGHVCSPTFTLLEPYKLATVTVYHFDLYRLQRAEELIYIGSRDCFTKQNICLVEWAERGQGFLPKADLLCNFIFGNQGKRRVELTAHSGAGANVINNLHYDDAKS